MHVHVGYAPQKLCRALRVRWCVNNPAAQCSVVQSLSLSLHQDYTTQLKYSHLRDMVFMLELLAAFLRSHEHDFTWPCQVELQPTQFLEGQLRTILSIEVLSLFKA
jgi:hypothetical protein